MITVDLNKSTFVNTYVLYCNTFHKFRPVVLGDMNIIFPELELKKSLLSSLILKYILQNLVGKRKTYVIIALSAMDCHFKIQNTFYILVHDFANARESIVNKYLPDCCGVSC